MRWTILFFWMSGLLSPVLGHFFEDHARGWHWYEDPEREQQAEEKNPVSQKKPVTQKLTPTQQIKAYQQDLEQKLHQALTDPTPDHVAAYMEAQIKGQEMAQKFSEAWMQVVYTHPHLDGTRQRPLSHVGRQIVVKQDEEDRKQTLKKLAQTHGLFFFFDGQCPYCQAFASVVKTFAETYGFKVLPISLDGRPLPEFPNPQKDNGIARKFGLQHVPVLLAVEPQKGHVIPLSHGFVSQAELETRAHVLASSPSSTERTQP